MWKGSPPVPVHLDGSCRIRLGAVPPFPQECSPRLHNFIQLCVQAVIQMVVLLSWGGLQILNYMCGQGNSNRYAGGQFSVHYTAQIAHTHQFCALRGQYLKQLISQCSIHTPLLFIG